jgi:hypothetical protein
MHISDRELALLDRALLDTPDKPDMNFTFRAPFQDAMAVKAYAARNGITTSEALRRAIKTSVIYDNRCDATPLLELRRQIDQLIGAYGAAA